MSDSVRIVEVGPRDGLQNEKTPVSVDARIAFIEALLGAGLHTVEVGAFVSPKAIPQMVNSDAVLRGISHHMDGEFHVLVPNEKGYDAARRRRQGDRGVCLGLGRLFLRQYQLFGG
jgi:hydroxymethylglutaryl-CoA lyase